MSIRHTAKVRRGAAAIALTAGLIVAVAGCGAGDDAKPEKESSTQRDSSDRNSKEEHGESEDPESSQVLAEVQGEGEVTLVISSVERDAGGFVTVSGSVKNSGSKAYFDTPQWRGNEKEIVSNGYSLGGAALVDQKGKKRYYVLRDTEGRCLCTTGITKIEAGEEVPIFAQFPAPPEGTEQIEFTLPTFDSATVEISPSE